MILLCRRFVGYLAYIFVSEGCNVCVQCSPLVRSVSGYCLSDSDWSGCEANNTLVRSAFKGQNRRPFDWVALSSDVNH